MLLSEDIIKLAKSVELTRLLEAKKRSDVNDYTAKNNILSDLLRKNPSQFKIDSELNSKYVGLTHKPSGFRIHAPRRIIPAGIETKFDETKKQKGFVLYV
jgi:hypothetical protein